VTERRERLEGDAARKAWRWSFVSPQQFACPRTGKLVVDVAFMDKADAMFTLYGRQVQVTDGYWSLEHAKRVSSMGALDPHVSARAIRVATFGKEAHALVTLALASGFTGLGVSQSGRRKKSIDLDDLPVTTPSDVGVLPRPWVWSF